jgi:hypothetical protein
MWTRNKCKIVRCHIFSTFLRDVLDFFCSTSCRKQFFQEIGEIIEIRVGVFEDGKSKGFAHVEFATTEAAQKVLHYVSLWSIDQLIRGASI